MRRAWAIVFAVYLASVIVVLNQGLVGIGMGVIAMMKSVANLIAMPLFGYITAGGQWSNAIAPTVCIVLIGVICTILLARVKKTVPAL